MIMWSIISLALVFMAGGGVAYGTYKGVQGLGWLFSNGPLQPITNVFRGMGASFSASMRSTSKGIPYQEALMNVLAERGYKVNDPYNLLAESRINGLNSEIVKLLQQKMSKKGLTPEQEVLLGQKQAEVGKLVLGKESFTASMMDVKDSLRKGLLQNQNFEELTAFLKKFKIDAEPLLNPDGMVIDYKFLKDGFAFTSRDVDYSKLSIDDIFKKTASANELALLSDLRERVSKSFENSKSMETFKEELKEKGIALGVTPHEDGKTPDFLFSYDNGRNKVALAGAEMELPMASVKAAFAAEAEKLTQPQQVESEMSFDEDAGNELDSSKFSQTGFSAEMDAFLASGGKDDDAVGSPDTTKNDSEEKKSEVEVKGVKQTELNNKQPEETKSEDKVSEKVEDRSVESERKEERPLEKPVDATIEQPKAEVLERPQEQVKEETKAETKSEDKVSEKVEDRSVESERKEERPLEKPVDVTMEKPKAEVLERPQEQVKEETKAETKSEDKVSEKVEDRSVESERKEERPLEKPVDVTMEQPKAEALERPQEQVKEETKFEDKSAEKVEDRSVESERKEERPLEKPLDIDTVEAQTKSPTQELEAKIKELQAEVARLQGQSEDKSFTTDKTETVKEQSGESLDRESPASQIEEQKGPEKTLSNEPIVLDKGEQFLDEKSMAELDDIMAQRAANSGASSGFSQTQSQQEEQKEQENFASERARQRKNDQSDDKENNNELLF